MTTLVGFATPAIIGAGDARRNPDVQALPPVVAGGALDSPIRGFGVVTDTQPVNEPQNPRAGFRMIGYEEDYYNTIWIYPNPVDLGDVVDGQTAQVTVWNAYLTPQALDTITAQGNEGLTLLEVPQSPTLYKPLESRFYTIVVSDEGPASINADYIFPFSNDIVALKVFGTRTVLFAFPPNWSERVDEWLEWLTDVLTAYDGGEQRRGLVESPRRGFEFEPVLAADERRLAVNILHSRQGKSVLLPIWVDGCRTNQALAIDDVTIPVNATADRGFKVGQQAMIYQSPLVAEMFQVAAISAGALVATAGLLNAWPSGTRVYPLRAALFQQNQKINRLTAGVHTARLGFELVDREPGDAVESGVLYREEPVYLAKPNWANDLTDEFRRKLEILDYQTGKPFIHDESDKPKIFSGVNWPLKSRAERAQFVKWLYARAGKYNGVWIPSHNADLIVTEYIGAADSTIDVRYSGYSQFVRQAENRRDIIIFTKSGAYYIRRIYASERLSTDIERLSVGDDVLGVGIDPGQIAKVCYLMYMRLGADKIKLRHLTAEVAECELTLETTNDVV